MKDVVYYELLRKRISHCWASLSTINWFNRALNQKCLIIAQRNAK